MTPMLLSALAAVLAVSAAAAPAEPVGVSTAIAASEARLLAACVPNRPLDAGALLTNAVSRADLETLTSDEARALIDYAVCRELQGAPDGCAALEGLRGGFTGGPLGAASACRAAAAHDRFVVSVLGTGDALGDCRRMFAADGRPPDSTDRACRAVIAAVREGDALKACPALEREKLIGPGDDCADNLASWDGKSGSCKRIKDAEARRECRARAALAAGVRDPAVCAASPACLVLKRNAVAACEGPLNAFTDALCPRLARSAAETKRRLELERTARGREQLKKEAEFARESAAKAKREALVAAKAEAQAKALAAAEAKKAANAAKPQYRKGQPMKRSGDIKDIMEKLEKGVPLPKAKDKDGNGAEEGVRE